MKILVLALVVAFCGLLACKGPKNLVTRMNNRPTASFSAEAKKENGQWKVEMLLPVGTWAVKTDENQTLEIIPGNPRSTLRWKVTQERWGHVDKPFFFELHSQVGPPINMSVKYPYAINTIPSILLTIIASSSPHF